MHSPSGGTSLTRGNVRIRSQSISNSSLTCRSSCTGGGGGRRLARFAHRSSPFLSLSSFFSLPRLVPPPPLASPVDAAASLIDGRVSRRSRAKMDDFGRAAGGGLAGRRGGDMARRGDISSVSCACAFVGPREG